MFTKQDHQYAIYLLIFVLDSLKKTKINTYIQTVCLQIMFLYNKNRI